MTVIGICLNDNVEFSKQQNVEQNTTVPVDGLGMRLTAFCTLVYSGVCWTIFVFNATSFLEFVLEIFNNDSGRKYFLNLWVKAICPYSYVNPCKWDQTMSINCTVESILSYCMPKIGFKTHLSNYIETLEIPCNFKWRTMLIKKYRLFCRNWDEPNHEA